MLALTSVKLTSTILILIPVVVAPLVVIAAGSGIVARFPGPHRQLQRTGRRDPECHPNGAGIHDGDLQSERYAAAVEDSFDAAIRRTRCVRRSPRGRHPGVRRITFVLWLGAHQVLAAP